MQLVQEPILAFIGAPDRCFIIPAYQRAYAWQHDQCFELWLDVQRAARTGKHHFTGTILCAAEETDDHGAQRLAVIDGQQRLTTVCIMLAALCTQMRQGARAVPGITAESLASMYLVAQGEGPVRPKLLPSRNDAEVWTALVDQIASGAVPNVDGVDSNIARNFAFFCKKMAGPDTDLTHIWAGLQLLFAIDAQVDDPDQAQLVFESLNSKGRPLTVADMVRNHLLLSESRSMQERLFQEYWQPMEDLFAPDPGSLRLDSAIKGWLAVRFRKTRMRSPESVYSGFKQYVEDTYAGTKEDLLRELRGFCLVWAENYRYHAVKKFRSSYDWAINGAPTLVSGYPLKKAHNEAYAEKVRAELRAMNAQW